MIRLNKARAEMFNFVPSMSTAMNMEIVGKSRFNKHKRETLTQEYFRSDGKNEAVCLVFSTWPIGRHVYP